MPCGTFRERKIEPALGCKKSEADEKKRRPGLYESLVESRSRTMIEEWIRDPRCGRKKRDEDREWDDEKNHIDHGGDSANPESGVGQWGNDREVIALGCSLLFQEVLLYRVSRNRH